MPVLDLTNGDDNTPLSYSELQNLLKEAKEGLKNETKKSWQRYWQEIIDEYSRMLKELDKALGVRNCGGIGNYEIENDV